MCTLLTLGACARVTVVILCVCVSVCLSVTTLTATYLVCDVIRFLMAFQTHDLCGFCIEHFVHRFWRHLLILSFNSMTLRIIKTCVYILSTRLIARLIIYPVNGTLSKLYAGRRKLNQFHFHHRNLRVGLDRQT